MGSHRRSRSLERRVSKRRRRRHSTSVSRTSSSATSYERTRKRHKKTKSHSKKHKRRHHRHSKRVQSSSLAKGELSRNRSHTQTPSISEASLESVGLTATNANVTQASITANSLQTLSNSSSTQNTNILPAQAYTSHINVVPEFDPSDGSQNIECWIHKVNECAQIYSWNETQIRHYALAKLTGLAKRWYQGLPSLLFTWDQWMGKLKSAFPSTENYGDLLQIMLQLRCKLGQSLDIYYYEKMILINKCEISGRKAVGCLVQGIDDKFIRMSANSCRFEEPEQLFSYIKTLALSDGNTLNKRRSTWNKDGAPPQEPTNSSVETSKPGIVCYNCYDTGHIRSKCTKPLKPTDDKMQ